MTSISDFLNPGIPKAVTAANWKPVTRTLPNNSGSYQTPIFQSNPTPPPTPPVQVPPGYMNPSTGKLYSAQEIVDNLAKKLPIGKPPIGDVPNFAGDQMTQGPQSEQQIISTATDLNNARNDIATGTTDPYRVNQSGIAYSPEQLTAIRNAYAGVYDPVLKEVFAKLDTKQKEDAKKVEDASWKEKQIFTTNENIRQWKATTEITKPEGDKAVFTNTQLNSGAGNASMSIESFKLIDDDLKNYFINMPKGTDPVTEKAVPMDDIFDYQMAHVKAGKMTHDDLVQLITDSDLSPSVKTYYIDKIPADPAKKQGWMSKVWGGMQSAIGSVVN